jgi:hypothetical protein
MKLALFMSGLAVPEDKACCYFHIKPTPFTNLSSLDPISARSVFMTGDKHT